MMISTEGAPEVAKGTSLPEDDFHPHWFSLQWPQVFKHLDSLVSYPLSHPCPPKPESKNQNAPKTRRQCVKTYIYKAGRQTENWRTNPAM